MWLVRVLDGVDPAPTGSTRFSDVDAESWWAPYVERLAELEVTVGCRTEPLRYCPDSAVSRAQMATFLVRAFKLETDVPSAGFADTCGLRRDGRIFCWGDEHREIVEPASRDLVSIAVGRSGGCGLEADGTLVCWLNRYDERDGAPDGQISVGIKDGLHGCRQRSANSFGRREYGHGYPYPRHVTCFGIHYDRDPGQPREPVVAIAVGDSHACAVLADRSISCWGSGGEQADAAEGQFTAVAAGGSTTCGLRSDNTIDCWGSDFYGQADPPQGTSQP